MKKEYSVVYSDYTEQGYTTHCISLLADSENEIDLIIKDKCEGIHVIRQIDEK